jgi:hypothetical protein
MITVTFPDGAQRDMQAGSTGLEIAASISKSLSKKGRGHAGQWRARRSVRSDPEDAAISRS